MKVKTQYMFGAGTTLTVVYDHEDDTMGFTTDTDDEESWAWISASDMQDLADVLKEHS